MRWRKTSLFELEADCGRVKRPAKYILRVAVAAVLLLTIATSRLRAETGTCDGQLLDLPFSDVAGAFFCSIAEVYFLDLVSGYADGTFRPLNEVRRGQMA